MSRWKEIIKNRVLPFVKDFYAWWSRAYDVKIDGIYYKLTSEEDSKTAEVTISPNKYNGHIDIPSRITYKGVDYDVNTIGQDSFRGCRNLTSVTIPYSVKSICESAFAGCRGLNSVIFPCSVKSIGHYAFVGCKGLTSINIPNSVMTIGYRAFDGCRHLALVRIEDGVGGLDMDNTFIDCPLTNVYIGRNIKYGEGHSPLSNQTELISLQIGKNVTKIGLLDFWGCNGLSIIKVEDGNSVYDSRDNCNAIIETASNAIVLGCKNTIIPNSVESIRHSAFHRCEGLTSIIIPCSVRDIGESAFSGCSSLTSITFYNGVKDIGDSAFSWCSSLTSITIPNSVESIGIRAFYGCRSLKSVRIEDGKNTLVFMMSGKDTTFTNCPLTNVYLGRNIERKSKYDERCAFPTEKNTPFEEQKGLTSLQIGSNVTHLTFRAFSGCSSLATVVIPNGVTTIGYMAFSFCHSLTSIKISNSVTNIDYYAFMGCSNLATIIIPSSVKSIKDEAFSGCRSLVDIHCQGTTPPYFGELRSFDSETCSSAMLYVPRGALDAYKKSGWRIFKNIVEEKF